MREPSVTRRLALQATVFVTLAAAVARCSEMGPPTRAGTIAVHDGNGETAPAGSALPIPPSVLITDTKHQAVAGVGVTFAVASGGGSLTGANQNTDAAGIATAGAWTLGLIPTTNTVTATASIPSPRSGVHSNRRDCPGDVAVGAQPTRLQVRST